jgi:HYDIN/CFA65/VesB family protein
MTTLRLRRSTLVRWLDAALGHQSVLRSAVLPLGLVLLAGCSAAERPSSRFSETAVLCNGTPMTEAKLAEHRGITLQTLHGLRTERGLTLDDICVIPAERLRRALWRAENPKPDHPGENMRFRQMQWQDERGAIAPDGLMRGYQHVADMLAEQTRGSGIPDAGISRTSWTWLGPGNVGGRIRAIAIHPTDTDTMWIGSVAGGIWKTTNAGASWAPVDDFMANLAVTSLILDPQNSSIMYAATGEGFFNVDALRGAGIFKSTNGGTTWTQLRSTSRPAFYYVNRLAISPDGATLLAATQAGIFQSTNGGAGWTLRWATESLDVKFHPSDSTRAIAGHWTGALVSSDGGQSWSSATGVPGTGRCEVAYAPSNGNIVYASCDSSRGRLYRSATGGVSFTLVNTGNSYLGNQGWYDNVVWVDPTNPAVVMVGGIDLWRSTNKGATLTKVSRWFRAPTQSAHADHHAIVAHPGFNGTSNRVVFFGNDGGIYRTDDIYAVASLSGWQALNNNLGITQFFSAAGNATSGLIVGGTQDNGTLRYAGAVNGWTSMFGGDGGFSAADPTDPNYMYGEYAYLQIHRSTNGGVSAAYIWSGIADAGASSTANFTAPFILDPNNPAVLLAGGGRLWRTSNVKAVAPAWSAIKAAVGSHISAIAVARGNSNIIWVAHNNGSVYTTTNGLAASPTWTKVDDNVPALPNRMVLRIVIDPTQSSTVYVTFGGFTADNVYRTTDGGTTWANIAGAGATALPAVPVRGLAISPINADWLYAGTEIGIFTSENGGATWTVPHDGPANVSVDELVWLGTRLVAATHGRGVFMTDVGTAQLSVTPVSLDFGTVPVNTTGNASLTIQNTGSGTLSGSAVTSAPFSIVSGGIFNLGPGATQTVTVGFRPTSASTFGNNVTVTSNVGNRSPSVTGVGAPNTAPATPSDLGQFQSDATTAIGVGGSTSGSTVVLKGLVSDPDNGPTVKLQVEVRPLGTAFSNTMTHESALGPSGRRASVAAGNLAPDTRYHWQAQALDSLGGTSGWIPYGGNAESAADFRVTASRGAR